MHPFRHPSYHAQQLRAVLFAKAKGRRVFWVTAHDVLRDTEATRTGEKAEARKERWLEFHDRFTSGIPGLLPLVLDLPRRFTEAPNPRARALGVFKNARGFLRGWGLPPEEEARLQELPDAEVVIVRRPTCLFIELPATSTELPLVDGKRSYTLRMQARPWSVDRAGNVKVLRHGFPVVPDFGGTAHAYCGGNLDACLGDLLPWDHKPRQDWGLVLYFEDFYSILRSSILF